MAALARWERGALRLWILVTGSAAAGMLLGVFWWWGVLIVTIPMLFAAYYGPTIWLYLTPSLLVWLALRRRSVPLAAVASLGAMLFVAMGVPWLLNRAEARAAAGWPAGDRKGTVAIPPHSRVALLDDLRGTYCDDKCVALLLDRDADSVLLDTPGPAPLDLGRAVARLRLLPRGDPPCPAARWPADAENPIGRVEDLGRRLGEVFGSDRCLIIDRGPLTEATLLFVHRFEHGLRDNPDDRWPRLGNPRWRAEALARDGAVMAVLARKSWTCLRPLSTPLMLFPLTGADTSNPATWRRDGECKIEFLEDRLFKPPAARTPAA